MLLVLVGCQLNWPVEYREHDQSVVGATVQLSEGLGEAAWSDPGRPVMAGWPLTYYIAFKPEGQLETTQLHWFNLFANVGLLTGLLAFCWSYGRTHRYRARPGNASATSEDAITHDTLVNDTNSRDTNSTEPRSTGTPTSATGTGERTSASSDLPRSRRHFSLSDMVLLVSLVALCIAYLQSLNQFARQQQRNIEARAGQSMRASTATQLPSWVDEYFVKWLGAFKRVREIELNQPDNELLEFVLTCDTLQSLRIRGGQYDLKLLDKLHKLPMLRELQVSGRELNAQAVGAIASCKQVYSLNLMRTNITAEGIQAFGAMPHLRLLNLIHTDIRLRDLGRPQLADKLKVLLLPHPDAGQADTLTVEDWPELNVLHIAEYDTLFNEEPVQVTLRKLPKLTQLGLDHFQLFDLTLDAVPKLKNIDTIAYQFEERMRKGNVEDKVMSVRSLRVRDSAVYAFLELDTFWLNEIDIQTNQPVSLRFNARPFNTAEAAGSRIQATYALQNQKVFEQLGQCVGPLILDFSRCNMRDVDFAKFAKIKSLAALSLNGTLPAEQVKNLYGLPAREIHLKDLILPPEQVSELIAATPTLERLSIGNLSFDRITVEHRSIKQISTGRENPQIAQRRQLQLYSPSGVRLGADVPDNFAHIVDTPELVAAVTYDGQLARVHIENAPALTQLRFCQPLPAGTILRGLRDLNCFAAGGQELRDEHFDAISTCQDLKTLCLLYSSVTSEKLKEIGKLTQLRTLALSGSKVDDEVLQSWSSLEALQTLRLKQTAVTVAGLKRIPQQFPRLERLTIDTPLDEPTLDELTKCSLLMDLTIQGSTLSPAAMKKLQSMGGLVQLDLSDCTLDARELRTLQGQFAGQSNKRLVLNRIKFLMAHGSPEAPTSELYRSPVDRALGIRPAGTTTSPQMVQVIHDSQASVRFPIGSSTDIVWLDMDEIWDKPFRDATVP